MTILITLDEKLVAAGQPAKYSFDSGKLSVSFGRDPSCDVLLAEHLTRLGRRHFEIRLAAGGYELVTDRVHPVYWKRSRIVGMETLGFPAALRLIDQADGPEIHLEFKPDMNGAVTVDDGLKPQGTVRESLLALRKAAVVGACVTTVGFGAMVWWERHQQQQFEAALRAQGAAVFEAVQKAGEQPSGDWTKVQAAVSPSVYQIAAMPSDGGEPNYLATAWTYDATRLATNAHVARIVAKLLDRQRVVAISPYRERRQIEITGITLHPAYESYRQSVHDASFGAAGRSAPDGCVVNSKPDSGIGAYDVAFLTVAAGSNLGRPLARARLNPPVAVGEEIAYIGYPIEHSRSETQQLFKTGVVSGFADYSGVAQGQGAHLIYHSAPALGGASGSPILSKRGEVVALLSGGETTFLKVQRCGEEAGTEAKAKDSTRVASGAGTFYAQNVALLQDAERGLAAPELAALKEQWSNTNLFRGRISEIAANIAAASSPDNVADREDGEFARDERLAATASRAGTGAFVDTREYEAGTYLAFAMSREPISLALQVRSRNGGVDTPIYVDAKPVAVFRVNGSEDVGVAVFGPPGKDVSLRVIKLSEDGPRQ